MPVIRALPNISNLDRVDLARYYHITSFRRQDQIQ